MVKFTVLDMYQYNNYSSSPIGDMMVTVNDYNDYDCHQAYQVFCNDKVGYQLKPEMKVGLSLEEMHKPLQKESLTRQQQSVTRNEEEEVMLQPDPAATIIIQTQGKYYIFFIYYNFLYFNDCTYMIFRQ